MKKIIFCLLASFSLSSYSASQVWDINDVSFMLPLPSSSTDSSSIKARDFIPYTWFTNDLKTSDGYPFSIDSTKQFSTNLANFTVQAKETFEKIRLVGVRIDPCFQDLFTDACRIQVRAVWQPVDKSFTAVDATIHTFYDLTQAEFMTLTKGLKEIKAKYKINTTNLPLQVHPGFKQKGFSQDFTNLIKGYIKPEQLTRIAFMKLLGLNLQWRFQSFDLIEGKLIPIEIPIRTGRTQTFSAHRGTLTYGSVELNQEERNRLTNGEALEKVFMDYALRIENPKLNLPGTTDCLSCHATDGLKGISGLNPIPTAAASVTLLGKYNLSNTTRSRENLMRFRAFGYVDKQPSISDRAILESAMVADSMNLQNY